MLLEALIAAIAVALISLTGALFFGAHERLVGLQRYVVPVAVGVFLALIFYELVPETLEEAPRFGGIAIMFGFVAFYVLANILHKRYHHLEEEECDRKGAAMLLLIGDGIHNIADGIVIGSAFMIDPVLGVGVALGIALHEVPQEIVEFGVLVRAGYGRTKAALLNLASASSIVVGVILIFLIAEYAASFVWILAGVAAGNLLFLAASDLLPRIHGNLRHYGNIWHSAISIVLGFLIMTSLLIWSHERFGHPEAEGVHEEELEGSLLH